MNEHPFKYIEKAAAKYGTEEMRVVDTRKAFLERIRAGALKELAEVYNVIDEKGELKHLSRWMLDKQDDGLNEQRTRAFLLFCIFRDLAEKGIPPFSSEKVHFIEEEPLFDWAKLPFRLNYLPYYAEKYGNYQFDDTIVRFADGMSEQERIELRAVLERLKEDEGLIDEFLNTYRMTEHKEAQRIYFLCRLISHLIAFGKL